MTSKLERWLREATLLARARRLHALMQGDFGGAITAELHWQARRESWVEIMERQGWDHAMTRARIAREEQHSDATCRAALEEEPGVSLTGLLTLLSLDRRSWIQRHLTISRSAALILPH